MAAVPGYVRTVTCPYNKSHNILSERFQTHLVKCAKNYPNINLLKCPFNTTHLVVESELDVCATGLVNEKLHFQLFLIFTFSNTSLNAKTVLALICTDIR